MEAALLLLRVRRRLHRIRPILNTKGGTRCLGNETVGHSGASNRPMGEPVCVFFKTNEQLLSLVVRFIQAGLEDNAFCM